jgi:hypothetical protein
MKTTTSHLAASEQIELIFQKALAEPLAPENLPGEISRQSQT